MPHLPRFVPCLACPVLPHAPLAPFCPMPRLPRFAPCLTCPVLPHASLAPCLPHAPLAPCCPMPDLPRAAPCPTCPMPAYTHRLARCQPTVLQIPPDPACPFATCKTQTGRFVFEEEVEAERAKLHEECDDAAVALEEAQVRVCGVGGRAGENACSGGERAVVAARVQPGVSALPRRGRGRRACAARRRRIVIPDLLHLQQTGSF
eukprot:364370-Chlamydomonas_euryale.AAC.8